MSKIGYFGPKCPKMEVSRIFLGIPSLIFSETLQLIRDFKREKKVPNVFLKKNPVSPILPKKCPKMALFGQDWPKFDLNLANFAGCWNSWISQKNKKVGVFETDFKQVPFLFRQTCTYSESWRPVENVCDPPQKIFFP